MKPADHPNLKIDFDRLWASLMELAEIGATEKGGVCRLALDRSRPPGPRSFRPLVQGGGLHHQGRPLGNIFARREGRDPACRR